MKKLLIVVFAFAFFGLLTPVFAYNNVGAHPRINELAIEKFGESMKGDEFLKNAIFDPSFVAGVAWDLEDGRSVTGCDYADSMAVKRLKKMQSWIIDGGFSADEPEMGMALRHFYDPVRDPRYLTDDMGTTGDTVCPNPHMDAVTWAFGDSDNLYSFKKGKDYFKTALLDEKENNENYGKAWRSVGETMHLISDMTVPAHVRNDGHAPGNYDIYEGTIGPDEINANSGRTAAGIGYKAAYAKDSKSVEQLMRDVAKYTNENFFSLDTVRAPLKEKSANTFAVYDNPIIQPPEMPNRYYYREIEGFYNDDDSLDDKSLEHKMRLATWSDTGWVFSNIVYKIDASIARQQRVVLIPTAIRASQSVLDAFLPRFKVVIDSVKDYPSEPETRLVEAHLEFSTTREWSSELEVKNGVHILVNGVDTPVELKRNLYWSKNLNKVKFPVKSKIGDDIKVYYNLGGYGIESESFKEKVAEPVGPLNLQQSDLPAEIKIDKADDIEESENSFMQWFSLYNSKFSKNQVSGGWIYGMPGFDWVVANTITGSMGIYSRNLSGIDGLNKVKEYVEKGTYGEQVGTSGIGGDFDAIFANRQRLGDGWTAIFEKGGKIVTISITNSNAQGIQATYEQMYYQIVDAAAAKGKKEEDVKIFKDDVIIDEKIMAFIASSIANKIPEEKK